MNLKVCEPKWNLLPKSRLGMQFIQVSAREEMEQTIVRRDWSKGQIAKKMATPMPKMRSSEGRRAS